MRRYLAFLLFLLLPFPSPATAQAPNYGLSVGLGGSVTDGEGFDAVVSATYSVGITRLRAAFGKPMTIGTAGTIAGFLDDPTGSAVGFVTITPIVLGRLSISPGVFLGSTWGQEDDQRLFGSYNAISYQVSPPGLVVVSISLTPVIAWADSFDNRPTFVLTWRVVLVKFF